jgi:pyruvate,water dikinase
MTEDNKRIVWFDEVDKDDLPLVGGKGANLGELTQAGIPVPPGFIVTTESYFNFIEEAGLQEKIEKALEPLNPNNSNQLIEISARIKQIISDAEMPQRITDEIKEAYEKLGGLVAVRSSATAEDLPEASFAGQQSTFLNINGADDVITAVQGCWASLFEARAIFYRHEQGIDHTTVGIAVPVQKMVQSEISGIMFTVEPVTNDDKISIEAIYGLGEAVVSGEVTPDYYLVSKDDFSIAEKLIVGQDWMLVKKIEDSSIAEETNVRLPVPEDDREKQKMSDDEIIAISRLGAKIEEHYGIPQDIEWAREDGELLIVQTRPITTLNMLRRKGAVEVSEAEVLLTGSPAGPGLGSGPVKIVMESDGISEVQEGDVLVAVMTTPDFVPAMKRASGIVTDKGGRTCHAAIISRELGIPCVVGANSATTQLSPEQIVTVDGWEGKVYEGRVAPKFMPPPTTGPKSMVKTRTKVYVNLAEPGLAEAVADLDVDGVGLLRAEFMIAEIGEHPRYLMKEGRGDEFISKLAEGLTTFARAFDPRPVVYRATDFKTNEYRHLVGGEEFEEWEENPMIGYRGCSRYIREPDVFKLEIGAIKQVREQYKNLWMMIPFVRTVSEMAEVKKILSAEDLHRSDDFKLWMMVEVPSNIILIDKFLDIGIDGVSIGSNDLTQLTLGVDRDNEELSEQFDERNEAVLVSLEKVIRAATVRGVTCSICGQAPSIYPEITERLIEWGITSISVNRDMIYKTREIIAAAELRLHR